MSIESWEKEFLPLYDSMNESIVSQVEHILRKFQGLSESNLDRHSIKWNLPLCLVDDLGESLFIITRKHCSFCIVARRRIQLKYKITEMDWGWDTESGCILCDYYSKVEKHCQALISDFGGTRDPRRIISLCEDYLENYPCSPA